VTLHIKMLQIAMFMVAKQMYLSN